MIKSYQIRYKKIYDDFGNNHNYYKNVFKFYESKYYSGKYNDNKIFEIIVTIQELIRDNFFGFYNNYSLLRRLYEESNEYILKIKDKYK